MVRRKPLVKGFGVGVTGAGITSHGANVRLTNPTHKPNPWNWPDKGVHAAWIGHATVLLKIDGVTVLTDPVLGARAGFRVGPVTVGLRRLVRPALTLAELPHIDVVLVSHAHMDHMDLPSLRALQSRHTTLVSAPNTLSLLRRRQFGALHEIGWGESVRAQSLTIKGLEVRHWGARFRTDTHRGYNGYLIESGRWKILFGGDTAHTQAFRGLRNTSLALMPVGAYNPHYWTHCSPEEAWQMAGDARADFFLPIHHQTFALGREPRLEPLERLMNAAGNDDKRVALQWIGQEFHLT